MAMLSEEDRKAILGNDWKPFVESAEDRSSRSRSLLVIAVVALLAGTYGGYLIIPTKIFGGKAPGITKASSSAAGSASAR